MSAFAHPQDREIKIAKQRRDILNKMGVTMIALIVLGVYLMPMAYGVVTSLKTKAQATDPRSPILPSVADTFEYEGRDYEILQVPTENGIQSWALINRGRSVSEFIDPANPEAGLIEWEGNWRSLRPNWEFAPQWDNYPTAWRFIDFARLLFNTMMYALVTMVGAVGSGAVVAYGFARFRFPFKNTLFIILISTIVLPPAVTLVPTYAFFFRIGWVGTWLPLIVPAFFANAYNVFLLRQYFLTIPNEMEEAAMIDGAGPIRTFISVILPQAVPALTAVALFHFFFAWNDFFGPLIYLAGNPEQYPISVGLSFFNGLYSSEPQLILAAAIITMIPPLAIFFMAQRVFIQGIVITGVDK